MNQRRARSSGLVLTLGLLGLIAVLIIPLPTVVLDFLLTINIAGSLLILMATLGASRPLDFSTFPSVILFTALLRLSLNVASTRLILLQGDAGSVIEAFGRVVVGGSYTVGIVVFLILVVIQFAVITKGQNRIAEVAARFALDAMPGKQMAIDADLNAGVMSNEEAKLRREELSRENEFYGAMDGAGKFIRGDAIAGLIITAINIVGGIALGVFQRNMTVGTALQQYTVLTVGDGLISQIPGLIVSIASGILVTKAASKRELGDEIRGQLLDGRFGVRTAGGALCALGLVPGFPSFPFLVLGSTLLAYSFNQAAKRKAQPVVEQPEEPLAKEEEKIRDLLRVDRLGIEIGYRLISLVDPGKHGGLLEQIAALRRQIAGELGIVVPPIRVKDDVTLEPNSYRIRLLGHEIAAGSLRAGQYLAIDPTGTASPIDGVEAVEPAYGLPAKWISEAKKDQAEIAGYTVIEAPTVLVTHLTELIKKHASELLSREDVGALLDHAKETSPTIIEDLIPKTLTALQVQRVLALLLEERIPIRNLPLILEALAEHAGDKNDPQQLAEAVRLRLARAITEPLRGADDKLHVATIDASLEQRLLAAIGASTTPVDALPEGTLGRFVDRCAAVLAELVRDGHAPILVVRSGLRRFLSQAILGVVPGAAVLSYQEVASCAGVEVQARISLEEVAA
ncbi:MAG: flagellar biosynthesis protein FlhA [Planctomycetes bacterium]|nr:flagellar biosynthesis protein FlhA [Planctomycetota bacterium]